MRVLRSTLEHPFELSFAMLFTFVGIALFGTGFSQVALTTVQDELPTVLTFLWATCLTLGGPAIIYGITQRRDALGRVVEGAGLSLSATAWTTYALTLIVTAESAKVTVAVAFGMAVSLACVLRILALRKVNRVLAIVARVADEED